MSDAYDLQRFVTAQDGADPHHPTITWHGVTAELRSGKKTGHWMWFVFPQVDLGHTPTAHHFAIMSRDEAVAYVSDPTLGARLREATRLVPAGGRTDASRIFGQLDARKFHSSMTLFDAVAPGDVFATALTECFAGVRDHRTLEYLAAFPDPD